MTYILTITPVPQVTVTITPAGPLGAAITVTPVTEGTVTVFAPPQPTVLTAVTGLVLSSV